MLDLKYDQYVTISSESSTLFNEQLNEEIFRLRDQHPVVKFSETIPFYAHIKYTVSKQIPETMQEASEAEGVRFVCAQCPEFRPKLKYDETEDRRCKVGDCDFEGNEFGRALKTQPACEHLYELIKEGKVKLCFIE